MKNLENLITQIPDYAKDVRINIQSLFLSENSTLSKQQIFGSGLASAYATKNFESIQAFENEAKNILSEAEINAVKTAASLMAMNNIYYRFIHLSEDKEYSKMPAGLRMKGISDHGIDKVDFEIFSLAVSIINGCGMCIDAHANQLVKHGLSKTQVQMIAKIAGVVNSLAQTISIQNQNS